MFILTTRERRKKMVIAEVGLLGQVIDCSRGINEISKKLQDRSLSPECRARLKSKIERLSMLRKNSSVIVKNAGLCQKKEIAKDDIVEIGSADWQNKTGDFVLKFHQQIHQKEAEEEFGKKILREER